MGLTSRDGEFVRDLLDADGAVLNSLPSTWGLATNLDGSRVAYTQVEDGRWNVFDVLVDAMDPRSPVPAELRLMGASAASESTGLVAGQTNRLLDGSCWAVVRHDTSSPVFGTCDHSLGRFSPDGRHLVGTDAYADGLGPRSSALLDVRPGDPVVFSEPARDQMLTLGDMAWEDDEHVLATVTERLESHTVRFGLDGSMELASDRCRAEEYDVLSPVRSVARR